MPTKHINLETHIPPKPVYASADETRITQVLINLLQNAVKFTLRGGTINLELAEQAGAAVFSLKDTGVGIAPELLPHLFTMFFQTNETLKADQDRLGIELALAKLLVDMHDGTIQAYSEGEGKGAEFTVKIPIAQALLDESFVSSARRVLVVDDNPDHLQLLADLLQNAGLRSGRGAQCN